MADVLGFLKKAAPWVAQAVASVAPGPIGIVAGVVAKKFGDNSTIKPTRDSLLAALTPLMSTDEGRTRLAQIEADTQKAFNDLNIKEIDEIIELEKTAAGDRDSARKLQATTRSRVLPALAIVIAAGYLLLLIGMMSGWLKASDNQALMLLLGGLNSAFTCVIAFYFGSSADSHRKTELLSEKK
jgi:hypothetical protein